MKTSTRDLVQQSLEKFAQVYGAPNGDPTELFNVQEPNVQQRLDEKIRESSDFLNKVNFVGVDQLKGEKLEMDVKGPVSRRNTPLTSRTKHDPSDIAKRSYELHEVQRDVMIPWKKLDTWSGTFAKFYAMFRNMVIKQRAHDILMTAWNGQFVAPVTDPASYGMLQDNSIGWIQQVINNAPEKLLGLNPDGSVDEIRVGPGAGDNGFENMDELVMALNGMIDKPFRTRTDLMAICGDDLVTDSYLKMYASFVEPSEKPMIDLYVTGNRFGRRPIAESAHFPQRGLLLTPFANLSRYSQNGTLRMKVTDDDEKMCLLDYYYAYEGFPVEMFETVAGVHPDAISIKNKAGEWIPLTAEDKWKVVP
jgi:P2 family phage major capsid protein